MKFHIHTLGCKVNQYESQAIETLLTERGHVSSPDARSCDVIIINTCSVTAESDRKSRQTVRKLRRQCPYAVIAVCGCFSQISPDSAEEIGADVISGSGAKLPFIDDVLRAYDEKNRLHDENIKLKSVDESRYRRSFERLSPGNLSGKTRALLKIQDGCSNYCAYCIIPYSRGPSRSIEPDEAAQYAYQLSRDGYKEIVITGIEIASYGRDLTPKHTLGDVVSSIAKAAPETRLRLGSLEPRVITDDFCRIISGFGNICPHFHLSLQSGCDETLSRMRRRYDTARFYESVELLRRYFPGCAVAADLITGFPGETDEEFSKTLKFIEKCDFAFMHIFPYSERPGTAAASMPDSVPKAVRKDRAAKAAEIAGRMARDYLASCVGKEANVLFEQGKDGYFTGHAENYCEVAAHGEDLHNQVHRVLIKDAGNGVLFGDILL